MVLCLGNNGTIIYFKAVSYAGDTILIQRVEFAAIAFYMAF